jgi:hypothetical protein
MCFANQFVAQKRANHLVDQQTRLQSTPVERRWGMNPDMSGGAGAAPQTATSSSSASTTSTLLS